MAIIVARQRLAQSRFFMHDAVDGGTRAFGCYGDRLIRGSYHCVTTSCTKSRFYALMLSTAAPEHSSATDSRFFRGSCRCITTSCTKSRFYALMPSTAAPERSSAAVSRRFRMLALIVLMLCRMRPPSFWVHCIVDKFRGNYRLLNDAVA